MLFGTVTAGSALAMLTVMLPGAAGASSVTVPIEDEPPFRDAGDSESDTGAIGRTVTDALAEVPLSVAEMFAATMFCTAVVVTVNFAEILPAAIETLAGTEALPFELASATAVLTATAELSVTVPVAFVPPRTFEGLTETDTGIIG